MEAIDFAKKHFSDEDTIKTIVPEWGPEGSPLEIYSRPVTIKDRNWTIQHSGGIKGAGVETLVYTIIRMAKDADGKPIFNLEHAQDLKTKVDSSVLVRVANNILGVGDPEDIKKN